MFESIKWLFFDVGGVLIDESSFLNWRQKNDLSIIQKYSFNLTMDDIKQQWKRASAMDGSLDENVIKIFVNSNNIENALLDLKSSYTNAPQYYDQPIRMEAFETLQQLSKKYKLGIIANQSVVAKNKLESAGLLQFLHTADMSGHLGVDKPNPEIFKTVLSGVGAEFDTSIMIDDNVERGLLPARLLGMKTIWYKNEDGLIESNEVDCTITNLKDLLTIL